MLAISGTSSTARSPGWSSLRGRHRERSREATRDEARRDRDLARRRRGARGALSPAATALLDALDYRQQVAIDEAARRGAQAQRASAEQALEAARKTVVVDEAERAQRALDHDRLTELWGGKVVSRESFDRARTALTQAEAMLERDRALVAARERDVEVARARVRSAREQLRMARILLGYTVLRAPIAGVILVRHAELGGVMLPGTPVVTMADLGRVWLRAGHAGRRDHRAGTATRDRTSAREARGRDGMRGPASCGVP
jgi:multidrug efflux pump subunit AcrA (membrane-fusion protein)